MSFLTGRQTIALLSDKVEVELNVSTTFDQTYNAEVTKHTVEKDGIMTAISDHVILGDRSIDIQSIISDSSDFFALTRMNKEAKLKTLTNWQTNGNLVTILGYGTGGILSKILEKLPSIFQYLEPEDVTERFMGTSRSEIANLMIGGMRFSESTETGNDIVASISLIPVLIAEAKTRLQNAPSRPVAKVRPKTETVTKKPPPTKSSLKSALGL